jgi:hypothetical protein
MSLFALRHILEHIRDKHYDEIDYIIMTGTSLSSSFGVRGNISRDGILGDQFNKRLHGVFCSLLFTVERKNEDRKPDINSSLRRLKFMPGKLA